MLKKNILNFSKITILCVLTIVTLNIRAHIFGDFAQWFFVKGIPIFKAPYPHLTQPNNTDEESREALSDIFEGEIISVKRYPFLSTYLRHKSLTNANDTICYDKVYSLIPADITAVLLTGAGAGFWYYKKYWNR